MAPFLASRSPETDEPPSLDRTPHGPPDRTELVRRGVGEHLSSLSAHARRLTGDASSADDLVQDSVLRAITFAWSFQPGTNLRAWLHQILKSVFLTRCRRAGRERRALSALGTDPCAWVRDATVEESGELSPPVVNALSRLPAGFRAVVRLVDLEDWSYREAASELSVPLGTVMSRLHRGRRLLASTLADPAAPRAA